MIMTDKRIKEPCPFCGTPAKDIQIVNHGRGYNKIHCPKCKVTFDGVYGKQELINKWNGRYRT